MGRERKPFRLGLDPSAYNPLGFRAYSGQEIAHEYARLRREAQQRLTRLGKSEFRDSLAYTMNKDRFKRLDEIRSRRELERLTQEAAQFVTARSSSASGQRGIRRDTIATLKAESGINWVNTKNFKQFTDFMEELRAVGADKIFYSKHPKSEQEPQESKEVRANALQDLFESYLETGEIMADEFDLDGLPL